MVLDRTSGSYTGGGGKYSLAMLRTEMRSVASFDYARREFRKQALDTKQYFIA